MPTFTTNFNLNKPLVANPIDQDLWGGQLNTNMDSIDSLLKVARDFVVDSTKTTSPYTVVTGNRNQLIPVDATSGNFTVDLIAAATAGNGFMLSVKKIDSSSNTVTIDGNGSETIDGSTTFVLTAENNFVLLVCDGSNWQIISTSQSDLTGGDGIDISGNTVAVDLASNSGLEFASNQLQVDVNTGLFLAAAGLGASISIITWSGTGATTNNITNSNVGFTPTAAIISRVTGPSNAFISIFLESASGVIGRQLFGASGGVYDIGSFAFIANGLTTHNDGSTTGRTNISGVTYTGLFLGAPEYAGT